MDGELKHCCRCNRDFPRTLEYFGKDKRKKTGLNYACRECLGGHFTKQAKDGYKICSICGKELPSTKEFFNSKSTGINGLRSQCKECQSRDSKEFRKNHKIEIKTYHKKRYQETKDSHREKRKKWTTDWIARNKDQIKIQRKKHREENRESITEYNQKYHQEHREENKIRCKEYCHGNKEYIANQRKGHYAIHKEESNARNKLWLQNNKDKVNESHQRRRALKLGLANNYTKDEWAICKDVFNHCCAYCGKPSKRLTQDHFIPSSRGGGYVNENIIPSCQSCNSSKRDKNFFEWYPKQDYFSEEREIALLNYLGYQDVLEAIL